jgi:hypothetical protein
VGGDAGPFLLQGVQPAVHGDLDEPFVLQGRAQRAGQDVLGDVQGSGLGVLEADLVRHLLAPHRPPSGPTEPRVVEGQTGQPLHQRGGVLAQHDGAGGTGFVLARPLVQDHARHVLTRQRQCQREPDGPRSDDDHRVHGVALPARSDVGEDVREQEDGAGCTITERMQPIAGACVK